MLKTLNILVSPEFCLTETDESASKKCEALVKISYAYSNRMEYIKWVSISDCRA